MHQQIRFGKINACCTGRAEVNMVLRVVELPLQQ